MCHDDDDDAERKNRTPLPGHCNQEEQFILYDKRMWKRIENVFTCCFNLVELPTFQQNQMQHKEAHIIIHLSIRK